MLHSGEFFHKSRATEVNILNRIENANMLVVYGMLVEYGLIFML